MYLIQNYDIKLVNETVSRLANTVKGFWVSLDLAKPVLFRKQRLKKPWIDIIDILLAKIRL